VNTKYVGRGTQWGNPYVIERHGNCWGVFRNGVLVAPFQETKGEAATVACDLYRAYAWQELSDDPEWLQPLRGCNLACWCGDDDPCHVDVIFEILGRWDPFQ